jgi:flagellin
MALTVATNTGALMAQAAASSVNKEMELSMERLSTGKRINSASDDAAGVAIASRLTSEIKGTNQAIRNAMDGQAMLDTAEGAHQEIETILQRMRELSVQAANDSNDANDRSSLQLEIDQLVTEIDRISSTTTWAGQSLLSGSGGTNSDGSFSFQVGSKTTAADTISTTIADMSSSALSLNGPNAATEVTSVSGSTQAGAVHTFELNTAVSMKHGSDVFTADFTIGAMGGGDITNAAGSNVIVVTPADAGDHSFVINGITVNTTFDTDDDTTGAAMVTNFNTAKAANAADLSHITATYTASDDKLTFTTTAAAVSANLKSKLDANADFASKFNATDGSGSITISAKANDVASTVKSITDVGTPGTGSLDATAGVNSITMASTGTNDGTNNSTIVVTINGTDVSYNSNTDGVVKGFADTATGHAEGLLQKIEDAGLSGFTMAESSGTITFTGTGTISLATKASAQEAINAIDAAIQTVNTQRGTMGAVSNRLDNTVSNLTNISSNLQAGRGRIEDADFAAETTSLAKSQILQQASTAMLAQANASKQNVLSLLQG